MNSYQMVLHRPVEPAGHCGQFDFEEQALVLSTVPAMTICTKIWLNSRLSVRSHRRVPMGCSKRMLNTIALISPFGTRQVALESTLPVPQGSPQHGLYPNENTTAEESRNPVP